MNQETKQAMTMMMDMIFCVVEAGNDYYALDLTDIQKFAAAKEIFIDYTLATQSRQQKQAPLFNIDWNSFMKMRNGEE